MTKTEKERKKKIQQLEYEIAEMQRDHADTFGYTLPRRYSTQVLDMLIFIVGTLCLALGVIWIFYNMSVPTELAFLSIGLLGIPRIVYAIPLIAGVIAFIASKKSRLPLILIFGGFALLFTTMVIDIELSVLSKPVWVYAVMLAVTCVGFALSVYTIIKMKKSRQPAINKRT